MIELERLDEAIDKYVEQADLSSPWYLPPWVHDLAVGAQAYRDLLANGERVEWCTTHDASSWSDVCHVKDGYPSATLGRCRIVSKVLVDYPTEEE